ncbi:hypothetical protein KY348_02525 [Candidatus Woesearchaeota archaeon]|nr:hypothetical protein [Candidatus Woesearchaeota archaeon]
MYSDIYSKELERKLVKLKNKDQKQYQIIIKKINQIIENPQHRYKFLHQSMKGVKRVHLGHFVLTFIINHEKKIVSFEDYDHHDKIYH